MSRIKIGKVALNPKGNWVSTTTYEKLDMVISGGKTFVARDNVPVGTTTSTTTYWQQMVNSFESVTTTTVSASTGASASIIGTPDKPVLSLQIPRGVSGNESIDDSAGEGDTDVVWSADKSWNEVNNLTSGTRNMFDPTYLVTVAGWTVSDGVYSGTAYALHINFYQNSKTYPITGFKESTRYTLSFDAYTDANGGTNGNGVAFFFNYSDNTQGAVWAPNSTTTKTSFKVTSGAGKTISSIAITYGSVSNNIWHLSNIQIEEGTNKSGFVPYRTADDEVAREGITSLDLRTQDCESNLKTLHSYIFDQTIVADFSDATIGSTYIGKIFLLDRAIKENETITAYINAPAEDANISYLLYYGTDGTRLTPSAVNSGSGDRAVSIVNTYGTDIGQINFVLVKVNAQSSYTMTIKWPENINDMIDKANSNGLVVPDYFKTQLSSAISSAQTNMVAAGNSGETFIFISDIHWENNTKHSPSLINAITKALPIENTIFCGDAFNGGTQAAKIADMNEIREMFSKASPRFLSVLGNHDQNSLDSGVTFTHNEYYTLMQKQSDYCVKYGEPYYYYMTNPTTKTAFIFLDSRMTNPSNPSTQLAWLESVVGELPNGYHIIVFVHVIYNPEQGGSWSDPTTWAMSTFMQSVCTYLDSVNTIGVKTVEAIFGGHMHYDYNTTTTGGIPIIVIDCDTRQTVTGNPQTAATANEQAFDIVTVNYADKVIDCTRVGRGSSRQISY